MNSGKCGTIDYPHQALLHEGTEKVTELVQLVCPSDVQAPLSFVHIFTEFTGTDTLRG